MEAEADREALLRQLALTETDVLTVSAHAWGRARGRGQRDHRAGRTTGVLSVAYIDVVGLKAANDERGHAAGDALLQRVVGTMASDLRSYVRSSGSAATRFCA